jgi:hypothetical protein
MFNLLSVCMCAIICTTQLFGDILDIKKIVSGIGFAILPYNYQPGETDDPLISSTSFRALCDHRIDYETEYFDPDWVNLGDTLFVAYHLLIPFAKEIHPRIKSSYILITNESTASHPIKDTEILMYDPKCAAWFSKNMILSNHPKLFQIPVGQTCFEWSHIKPFLPKLFQMSQQVHTKKFSAFLRINNTFLDTREQAIMTLKDQTFVNFFNQDISPNEYYDQLASHQFVIAPLGGGYDTCRFWESVLLGSIPITTHSPLDAMYQDVSCLIVEKWSDLDEKFLQKSYEDLQIKMANHELSREKAIFGYWKNLIWEVQKKVRAKAWTYADLSKTRLKRAELKKLKTVFILSPPIKLYILGKGLSLRGIQYLSAFSSYQEIVCLDEYLVDASKYVEDMQRFTGEKSLWRKPMASLISYQDPHLDYTCQSIQMNKYPAHVLLDLYYYHYNFELILERIWNVLPKDSIIAITNFQHNRIKEKTREFIQKYQLSAIPEPIESTGSIYFLTKK